MVKTVPRYSSSIRILAHFHPGLENSFKKPRFKKILTSKVQDLGFVYSLE